MSYVPASARAHSRYHDLQTSDIAKFHRVRWRQYGHLLNKMCFTFAVARFSVWPYLKRFFFFTFSL
jgi:hypothetical protein